MNMLGNHKGGLSVGKAIASGCKAADLVISYLESSSDDKALREEPSLYK
jgi:oxygen-dependent protoporphyrinogen oxidase